MQLSNDEIPNLASDEGSYLLHSSAFRQSSLEAVHNFYQSFIRWFAREDVIAKLLLYVSSEPFRHHPDVGFFKKFADHLHFLCRTASLPQQSSVLRRNAILQGFSNGAGSVTEKIWPSIFSGLLLHDVIAYFMRPVSRGDNTIARILLGVSSNQRSLSSYLGSLFPKEYIFWLYPSLLIGGILAGGFYGLIEQGCWRFEKNETETFVEQTEENDILVDEDNPDVAASIQKNPGKIILNGFSAQKVFEILWNAALSNDERLKELEIVLDIARKGSLVDQLYALKGLSRVADSFDRESLQLAGVDEHDEDFIILQKNALEGIKSQIEEFHLKNMLQYIYAQYLLWSLGKSKNIPAHLLFTSMTLYLLYTKIRLIEIFVQKGMEIYQYFSPQKICESQNKKWLYMPEFGDYKCTVCGDWPFVYYNDVFTSQGCLNGLLSEARTPEEISTYLSSLLKHPDFKEIDLSRQQWSSNWTEPGWSNFLYNISVTVNHLDIFNLSSAEFNPAFPDDSRLSALADFLKQVTVNVLDFRNQGMGPHPEMGNLTEGIQKASPAYLDISFNLLDDTNVAFLNKLLFRNSVLKTLIVSNNKISDAGLQSFASNLNDSALTGLDVSFNTFSTEGVRSLMAQLPKRLQWLNLSHNDLSETDMQMVGEAVANVSSLEVVNFGYANLADNQIVDFAFFIPYSKMKMLDFSGNAITDSGMFIVVNNTQNSFMIGVYFNDNFLTNAGTDLIATILPKTPLKELGLANANGFTARGLQKFLNCLPQTKLILLDLSENSLGDNLADVFTQALNQKPNSLQKIYLGHNRLTDKSGQKLILLFSNNNATLLSFDHNLFTDNILGALAEAISQNQFVWLDFSYNRISGNNGMLLLASKLPGSTLQNFLISNNQIGEEGALAFVKQLITPTPYIDEISEKEISVGEIRAIRQSMPQTNLTLLDMRNNEIQSGTARALCRELPNTLIPKNNLLLQGNPINASEIDIENCHIFSSSNHSQIFWSSERKEKRQRTFFVRENVFSNSEINLPENDFSPTSYLPQGDVSHLAEGNVPQSNNSNASAYLGAAFLPGITSVILFLVALYLLYRAFSPILRPVFNSMWEGANNFFNHRFVIQSQKEDKVHKTEKAIGFNNSLQ